MRVISGLLWTLVASLRASQDHVEIWNLMVNVYDACKLRANSDAGYVGASWYTAAKDSYFTAGQVPHGGNLCNINDNDPGFSVHCTDGIIDGYTVRIPCNGNQASVEQQGFPPELASLFFKTQFYMKRMYFHMGVSWPGQSTDYVMNAGYNGCSGYYIEEWITFYNFPFLEDFALYSDEGNTNTNSCGSTVGSTDNAYCQVISKCLTLPPAFSCFNLKNLYLYRVGQWAPIYNGDFEDVTVPYFYREDAF